MSYSFENINKDLEDLTQKLERWKETNNNKKIGYSPKCKVCNSPHLDKIEELKEKGYTLEDIKTELDLDLSIMSLSRHFKNHYPKNQRYKLKQQILLLENIREAYIKYPYLENYFKSKPLEYLEKFNNKDGFCTDGFCLCSQIEAGTVSNCYDNINSIGQKMLNDIDQAREGFYFNSDEKITQIKLDSTLIINMCLRCKESINSDRLDLLEKIITYNFLNLPIEDTETYFNFLNFKGSKKEFINSLGEIKGDTPSK